MKPSPSRGLKKRRPFLRTVPDHGVPDDLRQQLVQDDLGDVVSKVMSWSTNCPKKVVPAVWVGLFGLSRSGVGR